MPWTNYLKSRKWVLILIPIIFATKLAYAEDTTTDLQSKIDERNAQIKQLESEINQYNTQVIDVNNQAKTLQGTINSLNLTKRKINTDINLTQTKINKTSLTIDQINQNIQNTNQSISLNKQAIITALKNTQFLDDINIVSVFLSKKNISDVWSDYDDLSQVRDTVRDKTLALAVLEKDMELKQADLQGQKKNLQGLKQDLTGKKQAVEYTVQEQNNLLTETKNKEQTYKNIIATKEAQKAQFEKEVYDFESQLHFLVDPTSYPRPKNGILSWPLDTVFITQRFGKTVGAERLYTSGSHNGVDFRATIGTRVKNVLDGTVVGTGNTDIYPGCYSFGKWVLVQHDNGLSTIYGHLSVISVNNGQRLSTGDLVGFSGNTGYSTGPHLHITVYATQGVRIEKYVNSRGCKEAIIPLADIKAYLDPLAYFPSL